MSAEPVLLSFLLIAIRGQLSAKMAAGLKWKSKIPYFRPLIAAEAALSGQFEQR